MSSSPAEPVPIVLNRQNWNGQAAHIRSTLQAWEWRWKQIAERGAVCFDFSQVESIAIRAVSEDVEQAARLRREILLPALERGELVVLDFSGVRFLTQSFAHALLHEVFRVRGSLGKLAFRGCTKSTQESIRLVAAYSKVGYFQVPL